MNIIYIYIHIHIYIHIIYVTVCYSFPLFYFVICGDFNFIPSYSIVETSYNIVFGIIGLLIISVFGGGSLI